jgi:hypothetical protein
MINLRTFRFSLLLVFFLSGSFFTACIAQKDSSATDTTAQINAPPEEVDKKDSIQYFDQITQQPVFYERRIHDSTIKRIKQDEAYWYADQKPEKQKAEPTQNNDSVLAKPWVRNLVWIVMLVVFIVVLVWYLIAGNIRVFRKAPITLYEDKPLDLQEDLFSINFENEIKKAIELKNYRLAIRLHFLHALKQMNNNEMIVYKPTKTNADYLFHLFGTPYYRPFFKLTRIFDYVWYGNFQLNPDRFTELQKEFIQFNDQLQK